MRHIVDKIAKETLFLETLETRKSDHLDFHDLSVWQIKRALFLAYQAGFEKGIQSKPEKRN